MDKIKKFNKVTIPDKPKKPSGFRKIFDHLGRPRNTCRHKPGLFTWRFNRCYQQSGVCPCKHSGSSFNLANDLSDDAPD